MTKLKIMNNETNGNNTPTDRLQWEECNVFSVISLPKKKILNAEAIYSHEEKSEKPNRRIFIQNGPWSSKISRNVSQGKMKEVSPDWIKLKIHYN